MICLHSHQDLLYAFVVDHADKLYTGSVDVLTGGLANAIREIGEAVGRRLEQIAEEVRHPL